MYGESVIHLRGAVSSVFRRINAEDHPTAGVDLQFCDMQPTAVPVHRIGTPVMAYDLWGVSPLYENEDLKVGRIPTVTPIDQVPDEGNCGEVTNREEEACECAVKLTSTIDIRLTLVP